MIRLASDVWVSAYLTRLRLSDIPAFVVAHGDGTAGAILIKLNTLNGRIRGLLPNNGSPSRSGLKRTRSNVNNGGNAGTTPNRRIVKARRPTPPTPQLKTAAMGAAQMNVNNSTKRRANLNAYINALQRNLKNKGMNNKFQKNQLLNQLAKSNTNNSLATIKNRLKTNYNKLIKNKQNNNKLAGALSG